MAARKFLGEGKVGSHVQIGGIETSVLDDGPGRGTRIAWVNTGSGLRYKVVIDRGLDIADCFYNQHSLAWLSHGGVTAPRPDANHDLEWLYTFGGGILTTCGLTHIGDPESDEFGVRGLHGRVSNIPASVESIIQPDPVSGSMDFSITALVKQSRVFGPNIELKRTISGTIGEPKICIKDIVTNRANVSSPHMILYHCNFGWPLVDEGTEIIARGNWVSRGMDMDNEIFNDSVDYKKCSAPKESHRGMGESCAFIDVEADSSGFCSTGLHNKKLGLSLTMRFKKAQLPWLTNWQHWGPGEYICALEPGTNPPIGQDGARKKNQLIEIEPGESKTYELEIEVGVGPA